MPYICHVILEKTKPRLVCEIRVSGASSSSSFIKRPRVTRVFKASQELRQGGAMFPNLLT